MKWICRNQPISAASFLDSKPHISQGALSNGLFSMKTEEKKRRIFWSAGECTLHGFPLFLCTFSRRVFAARNCQSPPPPPLMCRANFTIHERFKSLKSNYQTLPHTCNHTIQFESSQNISNSSFHFTLRFTKITRITRITKFARIRFWTSE